MTEFATHDPDDGLEEVNIGGSGKAFNDPALIPDLPMTFRPKENVPFVATLARLERGPDSGYGSPVIAVFRNFTQGVGVDADGKPMFTDDDQYYSLWLIHGVALNEMKKLRPETGERVAGVYLGKKERKDATPAQIKAGNTHYHAYQFWCPDRKVTAVDWDSLGPVHAD